MIANVITCKISLFQLHTKYPLHTSAPVTFWHANIPKMPGVTRRVDPLQPFKKNSAFTKPLNEVLDEQKIPL